MKSKSGMRVARVFGYYEIEPIGSIEHVIDKFKRSFEGRTPSGVAVTYSISAELVGKLQKIASNLRVFCGKATKVEKVRGAVVTPAQTHFKGIMLWDATETIYYVGSSNLTPEAAGNYGIIVRSDSGIESFVSDFEGVLNYQYADPFFTIFNEIIFRETKGLCERCGKQSDRLWLIDGLFKCINCQ